MEYLKILLINFLIIKKQNLTIQLQFTIYKNCYCTGLQNA